MEETLEVLIHEVNQEIEQCKDKIRDNKKDTRKLLRSKDGAIEAGIDDYVFEDKINYLHDVREKLNNRLDTLKKIKYRLDVAIKMLKELN